MAQESALTSSLFVLIFRIEEERLTDDDQQNTEQFFEWVYIIRDEIYAKGQAEGPDHVLKNVHSLS